MYHSITFGDGSFYTTAEAQAKGQPALAGKFKGTNTWDDWHLIPSSKPSIASPPTTTNYTENSDATGSRDMTEELVGEIIYGDREGNLEFYVDNDHEDWAQIRRKMAGVLHGKRLKMVLEDDPDYYYEGRFSFETWDSSPGDHSKVTISYHLEPYKYHLYGGDAEYDMIWDTFCFLTDYDYSGAKTVNGRVGVL